MDFNVCLAKMRVNLEKNAPKLMLPPKPRWLTADDGLSALYSEFPRLIEKGELYWGALVQANTVLFKPPAGSISQKLKGETFTERLCSLLYQPMNIVFERPSGASVAEIIYNHRQTPEANRSPERLKPFAHYLYELKVKDECPKWLERAVSVIREEYSRERVVITAGGQDNYDNNVTMQSIIVFREHLPQGVLRPAILPLIAAPGECESVMLLPCRLWSRDYMRYWKAQ